MAECIPEVRLRGPQAGATPALCGTLSLPRLSPSQAGAWESMFGEALCPLAAVGPQSGAVVR